MLEWTRRQPVGLVSEVELGLNIWELYYYGIAVSTVEATALLGSATVIAFN